VVLLHGYSASSTAQEQYFHLTGQSDQRGFLYAMPDGTEDRDGKRFWNASDACCDFYGSGVDDSTYLAEVIAQVKKSYDVDPARVYLVGHSNGGFMAYRMACEHAELITAIVSLAGVMPSDTSGCHPSRPVSVLHIHGTADNTIAYAGGRNVGHPYPSAQATVADWLRLDGCTDTADTSRPPWDISVDQPGPETTVTAYTAGCAGGSRVELWTIKNGTHVPALSAQFAPAVVNFLYQRS
jgi:polyhydroxybutyrate depolymerase